MDTGAHWGDSVSSVQSCLTLCDPVDGSTPGFPVHHQLPKFAQTDIHWVGDVIQPSHPLSSPSPTFNLSQHQGLFQWVHSLHQVARVLELNVQNLLMVMVAPPGKVIESYWFVHLDFIICKCTSVSVEKRSKVTKVIHPSDQNKIIEIMFIFLPETNRSEQILWTNEQNLWKDLFLRCWSSAYNKDNNPWEIRNKGSATISLISLEWLFRLSFRKEELNQSLANFLSCEESQEFHQLCGMETVQKKCAERWCWGSEDDYLWVLF